ncbi:MAG: deoxyribose-phosphate aldolase [bacterium]|nr:deoxyribose-phosphate aldolase [bacterium]
MDKISLAKYLDLANHHADASSEDVKALCQKVLEHGFHSAFVNPVFVPLAKASLGGKAAVGTVVSFPLGQDTKEAKVFLAKEAVELGADELDVSMNVGMFKAGESGAVLDEMKAVVEVAKGLKDSAVVKFIIETGYLSEDEIKKASELVFQSGADFVKTCSGFGPRGATVKDVEIIKGVVGNQIKIKAAGGIDTYEEAMSFIGAGASRIGTSKAVEIVEGAKT